MNNSLFTQNLAEMSAVHTKIRCQIFNGSINRQIKQENYLQFF